MFYWPCSWPSKQGEGGAGGVKIEIVDIWKVRTMQNFYQLIIANASADVSGDRCVWRHVCRFFWVIMIQGLSNKNWLILEVACKCQIGFLSEIRLSSKQEFIYLSDQIWLLWLEDDLIFKIVDGLQIWGNNSRQTSCFGKYYLISDQLPIFK